MKLSPKAQNLPEWLALRADLVPVPLAHTHICFMLSKAVLSAFSLNVFEAFKNGSQSVEEASHKLNLEKKALTSLLNVLITSGYFKFNSGKYELTRHAKKWCLQSSKFSLYDQQRFNEVCWKWMDHLPDFLRTGKGLQYHETMNDSEWDLYQRGMESVATGTAESAIRMAPTMKDPERMLDIGGSHGLYSSLFCKKYPALQATILDLPPAVDKAEPLLKKNYSGSNIHYVKGNVLTDDLGEDRYDLIFISSLMHHFSAEQNMEVSKKVSRALKRGGYFIIQEFLRPETGNNMEMVGAVLDLFFNLSSTSGNWSAEELTGFQSVAELKPIRIKKFRMLPGFVQAIAQKK
jgi:ubiquinone/menaquinone biosynthesis C-methylase UbiE